MRLPFRINISRIFSLKDMSWHLHWQTITKNLLFVQLPVYFNIFTSSPSFRFRPVRQDFRPCTFPMLEPAWCSIDRSEGWSPNAPDIPSTRSAKKHIKAAYTVERFYFWSYRPFFFIKIKTTKQTIIIIRVMICSIPLTFFLELGLN